VGGVEVAARLEYGNGVPGFRDCYTQRAWESERILEKRLPASGNIIEDMELAFFT
jgi:hypothetical protein